MTPAFFVDAKNRVYSMLCDVIDYNDVISTAGSYELIKDVRSTDV